MTMTLLPSKRRSAKESKYSPRVQEVIQQMKDHKLYVDSDENYRILSRLTKNLSVMEQFYVDCAKFDEAYNTDPEVIKTKRYLRNEAIKFYTFIGLLVSLTVLGILGTFWFDNVLKEEAAHNNVSTSQVSQW